MRFAFTEEQEQLRATARAFLADHSASAAVRRAMESEAGFDPEVWKRISGELGWPALVVPEGCGGLGLGAVELAALLEVSGEALLCAPLFSSACLGAGALLVAGSAAQQAEHLPGIAAGESLATLAFPGPGGCWDAAGVLVEARRTEGGFALAGRARHVLDGAAADLLIVPARREGTEGEAGVSLFVVPAAARGVLRQALPTMDRTRRLAEIAFEGVRVPAAALLGAEGEGAPALRAILDRAAAALAAEQTGGAQRCLDLSVAHAKSRIQFGRPIGSFQAIQHACADMLLRVEAARSAAYYAACVAAEEPAHPAASAAAGRTPTRPASELPLAAALAKATCSEAFFHCAAQAIQIHGGVGFTWEYDVQLYFKRAQATESFLGSPAFHRERVAQAIGL
jgi:alkylation response protein AidB-like acyl-CoA dehydrogenase